MECGVRSLRPIMKQSGSLSGKKGNRFVWRPLVISTVMIPANSTRHLWLLISRGSIYALIGTMLFVFANTFTVQSGRIIGVLALVAGACGLAYASLNQAADRNRLWGVLHGLNDIVLGAAIMIYADGTINGFIDVLGLWAVLYAFLQSVQAMYAFISGRGAMKADFTNRKVVHFLNVAVAGALAYILIFRPAGFQESLGFVGVFPIALGVLIIVMALQMRPQTVQLS